ncbi:MULTISPECIES: adenosylmethionine--8-amino-7-oxononanoate transaminase [unclassified Leeuwenhoekiella]|uniref:adenosylmethionine--8-amino-7-oxononanoate transaminase n=1 Tax=unclassified Leeuwenhoekiella TaxID=2615029 RepID=UPI000C5AB241|nr:MULTISPECIES: adenosylmethionine--8-amino-7-oxononanoate transaminase [unclassified Leeuwenhoekiella]MAW95777.1 adenosylmethionine--8-amino-7-oxononanoate transaminase [Leeuwenhoekiella sp.]MBA82952.1 adenosylmethionine--8-amino-7-oxononanoate transaminase [Leeuwenhoekiella sp.]
MNLTERDKKHIWHPLTQHKLHPEAKPIIKAKGALLYDEAGKDYVDAISSWYTAMYGHCNDFITERAHKQMQQLDQIIFSGFTHEPAVELSEKLMAILPDNQQKLMFNDNGSTATEIGIKMALQYHHNKGENRKTLLAFEEGFHGDTLGAMSVSGLSVYNGPFEEFFIDVKRIPLPNGENIEEVLKTIEDVHKASPLAGFIYEPLVQGAAGMKMYQAQHLEPILQKCKELGIITVADEVMTGFGKTGSFFASDHISIKPDVMCLSKALTAGLVPMGITTCTQEIYDAFYDDDIGKGLFHAHTYSANPIACATAIAGIDLLQSEEIQQNIKTIQSWHQEFSNEIKDHSKVKTTRQQGVIFALELDIAMERYGDLRYRIYEFCMAEGVYLRPLGATIYILAPYITTRDQMERVYAAIRKVLDAF